MTTGLAGLNRMLGDNGVIVPLAPLPVPIDPNEAPGTPPPPASNEYRLR
jgi:hypothetical protein